MTAKWKLFGATAALAIGLTVWLNTSRAEDAKRTARPSPAAVISAMEEAGKPGPEHMRLQPFVGSWTVTARLWTDPNQPPAEIHGTAERKWVLGGRFVQESLKGEYEGKSFEGVGLLGYHPGEKKFTRVGACGLTGVLSNSLSTFDPAGNKFTCATEECCTVSCQKVKGRNETVIESNDKIVVNVFKTIEDQEVKVMEIVSIRKK
jgi:hypothetical protein